jgi:hypothetical protein
MAQGVAWIGGAGNFNDPSDWTSDIEPSAAALVSLDRAGTAAKIQAPCKWPDGTGTLTVDEGAGLS